VILAAAIALLVVAVVVLAAGDAQLRRERSAVIAEKADWWRRLELREAGVPRREGDRVGSAGEPRGRAR
jgi:hypothetical protein